MFGPTVEGSSEQNPLQCRLDIPSAFYFLQWNFTAKYRVCHGFCFLTGSFLLLLSLWYFSVALTGVILINLHSISSKSYLCGQRRGLSTFLTAVMCDKGFCSQQERNKWPKEKGHVSGDLFHLGPDARLVHQEWHDWHESDIVCVSQQQPWTQSEYCRTVSIKTVEATP